MNELIIIALLLYIISTLLGLVGVYWYVNTFKWMFKTMSSMSKVMEKQMEELVEDYEE